MASAGQVGGDPEPYDPSVGPDKQGFLSKRGGRYKSWKVRWFILQAQTLFYFEGPGKNVPKGSLGLGNTVIQTTEIPGKQHSFKIVTKDRDYFISAESEEERKEWMDCLISASNPQMSGRDGNGKKDTRISGALVVKMIEAENLAVKDRNGTSDPFGVVIVEGQQYRTNTIYKNLSPVWNEETRFDVTSAKSEVHVVLWDEDRILGVEQAPDFLGCVFVPLTRITRSETVLASANEYVLNDWFTVHPRKPNEFVRGRLHLELRLRVSVSGQGEAGESVFGVSLTQSVERQPHKSGMPFVVQACMDYIEQQAMDQVGIFRLSGAVSDIGVLRDQFNSTNLTDPIIASGTDANAVAGLLKSFLREMDPPLIPFQIYDKFLACGHSGSKAVASLKALIDEMPLLNRILLQNLLLFCSKVATHSAVNKMDAQNLAIVFAPNVLRPEVQSLDFVLKIMEVSSVFKTMIENSNDLFDSPTPPEWNPEEHMSASADNPNLAIPRLNLKARVLFPFEAQEDNELTVVKGQTVWILEQDSTGWSICSVNNPSEKPQIVDTATGRGKGVFCGLVPTSYLKPVK